MGPYFPYIVTMKRILAIDGGGIRGIIPSTILEEIEKRTNKSIFESFDLISGTSTGGILVLGLSKGFPAKDITKLYELKGSKIFKRSLMDNIRVLRPFLSPKYSSRGIDEVLNEFFGETRLSESLTTTLVTSYEIEARRSYFFKSHKALEDVRDDFLMRDCARGTSAAPTFFSPSRFSSLGGDEVSVVDGAMHSNNPAMCAYIEAKKLYPEESDFLIVSLGTGSNCAPIRYHEAKRYGLAKWGLKLPDLFMQGVSEVIDYQLRYILPAGRYFRIQSKLRNGSESLDNCRESNLISLKASALESIKASTIELDHIISLLK